MVGNLGTISGGGSGINFGSNGTVNSTGTVVNGGAAVPSALIIGNNGTFGTGINVGTTAYTGPLIESFVANDKIEAFNNAILNYSTATGLLQVTSGGAGVATLAFQKSSLGAGAFYPNDDGTGHLLITHS